jgi:hypothetical protein
MLNLPGAPLNINGIARYLGNSVFIPNGTKMGG